MFKYEFIKKLGEGKSSQVSLYTHKSTNTLFAIKSLPTSNPQLIKRELYSLEKLRICPHIIQLHSSFYSNASFNIVLEYCEGGSLRDLLNSTQPLNNKLKLSIICDLLRAVEELHSNALIHRDIKAENILFNKGVLKLSDFGISKNIMQDVHNSCCGTPLNMAPEVFKSTEYTEKVDIWSVGCVAYELLKGFHPFNAQTYEGLHKMHGFQMDFSRCTEEEKEFFELVFRKDTQRRGDISQVIRTKLVQSHSSKIFSVLGQIFDYYESLSVIQSCIVLFSISLFFITDPLYVQDTQLYTLALKKNAKSLSWTTLTPNHITEILTTLLQQSQKLNESSTLFSSHLLFLHKQISLLPDPSSYDSLLN